MKFPNPFSPPNVNSNENPSPSVTANRELHTNLRDLFKKVDAEPLVYYSKYLCIYTSVQYYVYLHSLSSPGGSNFQRNVLQTLENSVKTFDSALPGQFETAFGSVPLPITGTSLYYLNVMKSNPTNALNSLFLQVKIKDSSYLQDTTNLQDNVRYTLYESLRTSLSEVLKKYTFQDSNYSAKIVRDSMELLFFELLSTLEPYRRYFVNNTLEQLYTFSQLNASVSKLQYNEDNVQDNVVLSNFLKARGLSEVDYNTKTNWSTTFKKLYDLVSATLEKYEPYSYGNVLYNNVLQRTTAAYSTYTSDKSTVNTLNFKVTKKSEKQLSVVDTSELNYTNELNNRSVWYYNLNNIKTYNTTESYSNGVITLKSLVPELSTNNYLTFSLVPAGATLQSNYDFEVSPVTYNTTESSVFTVKLEDNVVQSVPKVLHESTLSFSDKLFNSNVLAASNKYNVLNFKTYYSSESEVTENFVVSGSSTNRTVTFSADTENWVKVLKTQTAGSTLRHGGYTTFQVTKPGTKYFSVEVPTDGGNFLSELEVYVLRTPSNGSDTKRYVTTLNLGSPNTVNSTTLRYSATFSVPQSALLAANNSFYLLLHYKSSQPSDKVVKFNNLYVSEYSGFGVYTFLSGSDFINKLYSYTNSSDWSKYVVVSYSNGSVKVSSEPRYLGTRYKLTVTPVTNKNLGFGNSVVSTTGKDAYAVSPTGYEKKFYTNFVEYLKYLFLALNSYALARLVVPEAMEEESYFNNDVKVKVGKEEQKGLLSDLLEDLGLTPQEYADQLYADPRSKFLKESRPQQDFPKELQWKSASLGSLLPQSQLNSIKSKLSAIKSAVKKLRSLLEAVRSFIEVLSALLELAEDLISAALDTVINQLQKVIDNIRSTGVYFLPLWDYYRTGDWFEVSGTFETLITELRSNGVNDKDKIESFPNVSFAKQSSYTKSHYLDRYETNKLMYSVDSTAVNSAAGTGGGTSWLYDLVLPFRATTYEEFVTLIEECFLDEDDKPLSSNKLVPNVARTFVQTGRPLFQTGSQVEVFIGAVTLPDPTLSRAAGVAFCTALLNIIKVCKQLRFIKELESDKTKAQASLEKLKSYNLDTAEGIQKAKQEIESSNLSIEYKLRLYLYGVERETSNETVGEHTESAPIAQFSSKREGNDFEKLVDYLFVGENATWTDFALNQNRVVAEPPNFVGVSLASLLPGVFTFLNYLVDRLRYFNSKKEEPTLAELLQGWLEYFEEVISELDDLLYLIEQITALIDAILGTSVTYLRVSTTKGVQGFLDELNSATNFPNEDTSQVILGFVGLVGFPTPNDPALNLSEYFSSVSKEFNQDASDLLSDLKLDNEGEGLGFLNKSLPKTK